MRWAVPTSRWPRLASFFPHIFSPRSWWWSYHPTVWKRISGLPIQAWVWARNMAISPDKDMHASSIIHWTIPCTTVTECAVTCVTNQILVNISHQIKTVTLSHNKPSAARSSELNWKQDIIWANERDTTPNLPHPAFYCNAWHPEAAYTSFVYFYLAWFSG